MDDKPITIKAKDGASRVFNEQGKLISIDGVPVIKSALRDDPESAPSGSSGSDRKKEVKNAITK
jgi:hypothetical protein